MIDIETNKNIHCPDELRSEKICELIGTTSQILVRVVLLLSQSFRHTLVSCVPRSISVWTGETIF